MFSRDYSKASWTLFYQFWVNTNWMLKLKVCVVVPVTKFLYKLCYYRLSLFYDKHFPFIIFLSTLITQMPINAIKPFLKANIHCSKYPNIWRSDISKVMDNGQECPIHLRVWGWQCLYVTLPLTPEQ